jgi:hypothetical protein
MAGKVITQQPVTLAEFSQLNYIVYGTGGVDFSYLYRPVDETGAPIGETRTLSGTKTGPAAQEIKTWIEQHALVEINAAEETAP